MKQIREKATQIAEEMIKELKLDDEQADKLRRFAELSVTSTEEGGVWEEYTELFDELGEIAKQFMDKLDDFFISEMPEEASVTTITVVII